jgi:hypothetical protein
MAELSARDFAAAKRRGEWRMRGPCAESAHYDADRNRIVVRLTTGVEIGFAPADVEGLENASTEELDQPPSRESEELIWISPVRNAAIPLATDCRQMTLIVSIAIDREKRIFG